MSIKEAFSLFENLLTKLKLDFISILLNLKVVNKSEEKRESIKPAQIDPKYIGKKMSRNEPFVGQVKIQTLLWSLIEI